MDEKDREIHRLQGLLKLYENISHLSEDELRDARNIIKAQENLQEFARKELMMREKLIQRLQGHQQQLHQEILSILFEDNQNEDYISKKLEALRKNSDKEFFVDLFKILSHLDLEEDEARLHWEKINQNAFYMSEKLGRPVGFRVAMLDYMINKNKVLKSPKIIEIHVFEDIVRQSMIDELTGLFNRRYYVQAIDMELHRYARYNRPFSLFLFDVDNFKTINDTLGHSSGDQLLIIVGDVLKKCFRTEDICCRYGGDEFAVILPDIKSTGALSAAKRFSDELKNVTEMIFDKTISVSGGITESSDTVQSAESMFSYVDEQLYKAKSMGKDSICLSCKDS